LGVWALRYVDADDTLARDVISKLLNPDPEQRFKSVREAIADPFFNTDSGDRKINTDKKKKPAHVVSPVISPSVSREGASWIKQG